MMQDTDTTVRPAIPERSVAPTSVIFHAGPTNSGKTHAALEALLDNGQGTYAAPLRMLAWEAFERLAAIAGEGRVGLVTGEERVNDSAPIICCTTEMAPLNGELLVLDEVHWADDPERGWAWTRLLLGAEYDHIHIVGANDALPLVRSAFPDAEVVIHERLCPLTISTDAVPLSGVPARSAVVAFSRKAVYHVAGLLAEAGRHPAVLYGAMPPGARRSEIKRFVTGEADVVVATDVIGHGLNLPVSAVLFAETSKFDGSYWHRNLHAWEVAQIAGRAGRYGFDTEGYAAALTGVPGLNASVGVVAKAAHPQVDVGLGLQGYRRVEQGRLAPNLSDLAATDASQLPTRLMAWEEAAVAVTNRVGWVRPASIQDMLSRLSIVDNCCSRISGLKNITLDAAWRFARSPLDVADLDDRRLLANMARAVVNGEDLRSLITEPLPDSLEALEAKGRQAAGLRWFTLAFPGTGGITSDEVADYEEKVTEAIVSQLRDAIHNGTVYCLGCGKACSPWFKWCDSCYQAQRRSQSSSLDYDYYLDHEYGYGCDHEYGYDYYDDDEDDYYDDDEEEEDEEEEEEDEDY